MRIRERFNPRAPCGARLPPRQAPSSMPYFNPCAPCGARRRRFGVARAAAGFQPTRPLRGATPAGQLPFMRQPYFNPRALAGRDLFFPRGNVFRKNFNPRALAGRDREVADDPSPFSISTHAPLRGATTFLPDSLILIDISTHAPLRGATLRRCISPVIRLFQPTRPCGARLFCAFPRTRSGQYFNPRAPCGARHQQQDQRARQ